MKDIAIGFRWFAALLFWTSCASSLLNAQDNSAPQPPTQPRAQAQPQKEAGPQVPRRAYPPGRRRELRRQGNLPLPVVRATAAAAAALESAATPPSPQPAAAHAAPSPTSTPVPTPTAVPASPQAAAAKAPEPAGGGEEGGEEGAVVTLNLDNTDIKQVINLFSELTGKNFILSDQARGNVTIIGNTKIPVDALPKVLESILEVRGLCTVPAGDMIKIEPRRDGVKSPIDFENEAEIRARSPDDTLVTQLVALQYADLNEVQRVVQTLAGKDAGVVTYPPANMLIISDAVSNLNRMMRIIKEVDVPGLESTITVVPLQFAAAAVLAEEVLTIISQKGAGGGRPAPRRRGARPAPAAGAAGGDEAVKIFADERTNSLIIVASPEDTERVLALVEELDRQTPESKTRVRVKRLSYSNSDDVAGVLTTLTSGRTGEGLPPVTVTSYPEINALVIDASPQDYELLERIVEDLDIPRDQVMIEVILAEVDLAKSLSAEFQTQTLSLIDWSPTNADQKGVDNIQNWGGTEFTPSLRDMIINDLTKGYPLSAGPSSGFNYGFVYAPKSKANAIGPFGVLLDALEADQDVNILSAPQVLTSDNEEVSLNVADRIPILTSTLTTGSGTTGTDTIQQVDYRDVGIKIKLIPHISKDRFVRIEVDQSAEKLVGVTLADIKGPITPASIKRETATVVTVKDKHTVVISGIIDDQYGMQESKVPILGDIPVVGLLARFRKNAIGKTNLMIFITPQIVRNPTELAMVTQKTRERSNEYIEDAHGKTPPMLDRLIGTIIPEAVKKLPPAGEAENPYGLSR